ncbi:MAG: zinc-binding alcohol dehydrogenase family protein [Rhodothermaceae bacterium]|nr:zinc-binding alcohol dehydrogenase family protein [Rhodothermaceae bacterium]
MKTVILDKPGSFSLVNRPKPELNRPSDALVRIRRIGVCGTDLHAFKGDQPFFSYPRVLGHELGVEIIELGQPSPGIKVGDFCSVEPYYNCGLCAVCKQGKTNCCERLQVIGVHEDGGMCEWLTVPLNKLHPSKSLPLEHLALVEMLTIGAHAVSRAHVVPRNKVLVIGAGPIGLSVAQFVRLAGADPIVFEMDATRRRFCQNFLKVQRVLDPSGEPIEKLKQALGGLPDIVFDATGNPTSMQNAFNFAGSGGTLVLVGLFIGDLSFSDPEFHRKELTLMSSRNATPVDFDYVIRMLEEGRINLNPWITHRTSLDDIADTFPTFLDKNEGVVKAMIDV